MIQQENPSTMSEIELANMRNNLSLLRSQLKAGRLDENFLNRQIDKLDALLQRFASQQDHSSKGSRFAALYEVSRVLGSSLDLQIVLNQVMDAIIKLTNAERGFLMLRDDDGGITVKAARNFDQQTLGADEFKFSRTVTNHVLDTGNPILTTNATEDPRFAGQASIVAQSLRSVMATPLRARGNVFGAIYVDSRATSSFFSADDLAAMDAFSAQAAIALDNALLFSATDEALSQRVEELRQLRRVDLLINETLDADKILTYTIEWCCRLAKADQGYIGLLDPETRQVKAQYAVGVAPDKLNIMYLDQTFGEVRHVMQTGATLNQGVILVVPIRVEQEIRGIVVLERDDKTGFTDNEQDLVERVVTRAAATLENSRLYSAIQAANNAKSEFVGIVAHDLKSPMTGIKGYADLLLMVGGLTNQQITYINRINQTVERMEALVSDLADISRIESGQFFMEESVVAIDSVIQAVKDGTLIQVQERGHTWVEDIEPNLPPVYTDFYRLLQVLTNLITNAYKYTPSGGQITLTARRIGQRVQFTVADTGIGLTTEQIRLLGKKFWRADDKFTRSQPGTGLGFSITRSLIEQMGDEIRIDSTPGQGSRFTFSVAIAQPEQ